MASNKRLSKRKHSDNENNDTVEEDEFNALELSDEEDGVRIDDIYIPPAPKPACSTHTEGPRLIITKIVNSFFKSYADQQILGPFTKCFNAIVGPNGSGKSNVIDSMLFVFGYRASKIRSKKISVLIHDSPHYRNVQSCTVEVHFGLINDKAGEECKIIPGSEFIVSRTANKDNSSFYQLNNRKVQFKEVAQVLRQHGIDLDHNRFLILQGEVEQIAMMKCKAQNEHETGMLEYLEDVIGTSRYIAPLKKLEERVEILEQKRSEKLCRVKLAEQELNELREPMQEAVNYLKQENNIITNKNILYQKKIYDLEQSIEEIEENKKDADQQEQELANKLTDIQERKVEKNKMLKDESRTYENLKSKSNNVKEAFNTANNRDAKLQAQMTQLNQTRKRNKELLKAELKRLDELERVPEANEKEINLCKTREIKLTTEKTDLETKKKEMLSKLQGETQNLYQEKEKLTTKLNTLKVEVNKTKTAFTLAESELKLCVSNEETEKNKLENLRSAYKRTTEGISEKTEEVNILKKKIPLTKKSLQTATAELNANKQKQMQLISTVQEKRTYVEETRASMQASHSRGKVLDTLMKQKQEGNCPGLFGRLGDLGAIDQKYDVAISTACGPLDNIVVDTVNTAQWCIEFLKKHNIGRATFIALEKQEHLRELANSQIQTPENVPRLYDLIKVNDERVKTAFYYALRNTLVANDLDQAPRIAYGAERYRVVTLRGDLIELTGTMSGGGKIVSRGRMGQSVAVTNIQPENLQAVETELHQFEDQLNKLHKEESSLGDQITTLQTELQSMERQYEKLTLELKLLKQEEPQLSSEIKIQDAKTKSTKSNAEQVKKLQNIVEKTRAEYEKATALADEVEVEVDKLTSEINEKVTGKIKAVDMNIMNATKNIDKCKKEITRLTVAITTAKRDAKNCAENIAMKEQEIKDAEEKLRAMKNERDEIEEHSKQLLTCIEDFTEKLVESEEKYNAIKEEMSILTKEENKVKSDKIEVDEKCKVVNKKISDMRVSIHQWKAKIASLKLQDIPDENITALKTFTLEELSEINVENLQRELQTAESHIKTAKPNLNSIQDFRKKQEVFIHHSKELNEISEKKLEMKNMFYSVKTRRKDEFITGYNIIKLKLKEMYQMITLGGDADFEMVDTYDPFTEGIQFNVRPPKKSWKSINNLSGGEKTLSSLALVFALHYYKPSPLYVMDEIDAALDFKNVSIVANYIKDRTKNAQFIIISLRPNMFELCDNLVGIYKTDNTTKSVTINPTYFDKQDNNHEEQTLAASGEMEQQMSVRNGEVDVQHCTASVENMIDNNMEDENNIVGSQ